MSLVFWLAALVFCSTECLDKHSDSDQVAQAAASADHHHSDNGHHSHDESFCLALRSFAPASVTFELTKPDFGSAFALIFLPAPQLISVIDPEVLISRQPPDHEWLFMPEVYLGPALHSHAPPFVA